MPSAQELANLSLPFFGSKLVAHNVHSSCWNICRRICDNAAAAGSCGRSWTPPFLIPWRAHHRPFDQAEKNAPRQCVGHRAPREPSHKQRGEHQTTTRTQTNSITRRSHRFWGRGPFQRFLGRCLDKNVLWQGLMHQRQCRVSVRVQTSEQASSQCTCLVCSAPGMAA